MTLKSLNYCWSVEAVMSEGGIVDNGLSIESLALTLMSLYTRLTVSCTKQNEEEMIH